MTETAVEKVPEEVPIPAEEIEICNCKKCRIKRFRAIQALGYLPKKPESKIVGKHEFLRMDNVDDKYFTYIEHKFELIPNTEMNECKVCQVKFSSEEIKEGGVSWCKVFTSPSQLDFKLGQLKAQGRKVIDAWKEWGGWTIKMMVPEEESA